RLLRALLNELVDGLRLEGADQGGLDEPLEGVEGEHRQTARGRFHAGEDALIQLGPELLPGLLAGRLVGPLDQLGLALGPQLLGAPLALGAGAAALAAALALGVDPAHVPAGVVGAVLLDLLVVLEDPRATHEVLLS